MDQIQHEVSICVGLGAGSSVIRLVGLREEENHMMCLGKKCKDLWDEDNIVPPLTLCAKSKLKDVSFEGLSGVELGDG